MTANTQVYWPYVLGLGIAAALFLAGLALLATRERGDAGKAAGAIVVALLIAAFTAFPFDMQYHHYALVSGTVSRDVGSRILTTGSGTGRSTSTVYAVPVGDGVYRCDDTRCSLLHKGDQISLWCIREWQWASTPGWKCRYDKAIPGADGAVVR